MTAAGVRRRNAADSRSRLLSAAAELFAERGYARTTVREVGQRAGVDPAMIARYFGSKAALYLEALARSREPSTDDTLDLTDAQVLERLLNRVAAHRPTPTLHAAIDPHDDPQLQAAAIDLLRARVVQPAQELAAASAPGEAALRAELATAAIAGIVLSRTSGALRELSAASSADVAALVAPVLALLLDPPHGAAG